MNQHRRPEPRPKGTRIIKFLVELDAILDTRVGLMDTLDPESAVKLVANPKYYERQVDKFEPLCGMDDDIWKQAWKTRGIETLKHSLNSPTIDLLHYMVTEVEFRAVEDPTLTGAMVDLNIYPYKLSPEEREALAMAVAQRVGVNAPIRIYNQPAEYFTPNLVRTEYYAMLMYDHNAWFKAHQRELFATELGIPAVTMYAPKLALEEMPPPELCDFTKHGARPGIDIFEAVAHGLQQYITLEYLPINHYCLAYPGVNGIPKDAAQLMASRISTDPK